MSHWFDIAKIIRSICFSFEAHWSLTIKKNWFAVQKMTDFLYVSVKLIVSSPECDVDSRIYFMSVLAKVLSFWISLPSFWRSLYYAFLFCYFTSNISYSVHMRCKLTKQFLNHLFWGTTSNFLINRIINKFYLKFVFLNTLYAMHQFFFCWIYNLRSIKTWALIMWCDNQKIFHDIIDGNCW